MDIKLLTTTQTIKRLLFFLAIFCSIGLLSVNSLKSQTFAYASENNSENSLSDPGADGTKKAKKAKNLTPSFTPGDTTLCVGVTHSLAFSSTSTGAVLFNWVPLHGTPVGPTTNATVVLFWNTIPASTYDTITLTVTDASGNTATATHVIHIVDCADFYADDYSVCLDTCVIFTDNSSGNPTQWDWTFGATTNDATPHTYSSTSGVDNDSFCVKFRTPGWHTVTLHIKTSGGLDTFTTRTNYIFVGACPHASYTSTIPANDTLCMCKCVTFNNTSISDPNSEGQKWYFYSGFGLYDSTRERNPTICFTTPGTFKIILVDTNSVGQDSIYSDSVVVVPCTKPSANIAITSGQDTVCQGECISFADTTCSGATNAATKWRWTFPGGTQSISGSDTTQNPTDVCFNTPGKYLVKLVDTNIVANVKGYDSAYVTIVVKPAPKIELSARPDAIIDRVITLIEGTSVTIVESGNDPLTYYWSFTPPNTSLPFSKPDSLSCDTCMYPMDPVANPTLSHWYYVHTVGQNGCIKNDSIYINVVKSSEIFVPNAFAPYGNAPNGANRKLYVRSNFIRTLYFAVYDRWGEKVWETTSLSEGWDGTYKGQLLNNGVFDWYLKATLFNGKQVENKGNVTLIR